MKSDMMSDICSLLNKQDRQIIELKTKLSNAIISKFKIGQKLYMIPTQANGLKNIEEYKLLDISLSDIGIRYGLSIIKKKSGIEPLFSASEDMIGKSIFATKDEALAKLEEIKNG